VKSFLSVWFTDVKVLKICYVLLVQPILKSFENEECNGRLTALRNDENMAIVCAIVVSD